MINAVELEGLEKKYIYKYVDDDGQSFSVTTLHKDNSVNGEEQGYLGGGTYTSTENSNGIIKITYKAADGDIVPSFSYSADKTQFRDGDELLPSQELVWSFIQWQAVDAAFKDFGITDAQVDVMYFNSEDDEFSENFAFLENPEDLIDKLNDSKGHADVYNKQSDEIGNSGLALKIYKDTELGVHVGLVRSNFLRHVEEATFEIFDYWMGIDDGYGVMHEYNALLYLNESKKKKE